jgi:hypothetical protein
MLAFKGTIRPNSKEIYRRTRNGKKQLIWAFTAKLTALHIEVSNRLKTILIFVKVANLVRKKNNNQSFSLTVPA